jgi:hypothetical protein
MKFIVPAENALKLYQNDLKSNIGLYKIGLQYSTANEKIYSERGYILGGVSCSLTMQYACKSKQP